jgi:L-asparaginase II
MTTSPAASRVRSSSAPSAAFTHLLADLQPVELVRSYRSGIHENSHYGSLVILDRDGSVIFQRGDVHRPVFHRSCAKPFQAVAMVELNAPLAGADLALAAASHSGEPEHVHRTLSILDRSGFTEDDLGCPVALPSDPAAYRSVIRGNGEQRRVYMNCSGKHAAMLATCRTQAWPSAGYLDVDHPLQQRIRAVLETATGELPAGVGVDGCGAPVYATSLVGLARAFGALAGARVGSAERLVADAMREHPEMVGGTGVDDTRLMRAIDGLVVKGGADGVHCAALPDGRSIALKIADGSDRARMPVLVGALRSLGLGARGGPTRDLLNELAVGTVLGGGQPVGTVEIVPGLLS